jgi:hypothetical protein
MSTHPYQAQPDHAFWHQAVAGPAARDITLVDPVVAPAFGIGRNDRIATAGSCFAQHVARHLRDAGVPPLVTEQAHAIVAPEVARRYGYGEFCARYGNVYTSRQLLQLMLRAFGEFAPEEDSWEDGHGRWIDPFRPRVHPGGFASRAELLADRARHFEAVRCMFAQLDVFVFTLGLTETWAARSDGAVFPVCPGVVGGRFDAARHQALNLDVDDVVQDLETFIGLLSAMNPGAKLVLTVSPVPLVATAGDRHVLQATTYSKAVLRVAAERLSRQWSGVAYFPSYEIITGAHAGHRYLADDLRSVTEAGVAHAMRLFLHHYLGVAPAPLPARAAPERAATAAIEAAILAQCDEESLARAV